MRAAPWIVLSMALGTGCNNGGGTMTDGSAAANRDAGSTPTGSGWTHVPSAGGVLATAGGNTQMLPALTDPWWTDLRDDTFNASASGMNAQAAAQWMNATSNNVFTVGGSASASSSAPGPDPILPSAGGTSGLQGGTYCYAAPGSTRVHFVIHCTGSGSGPNANQSGVGFASVTYQSTGNSPLVWCSYGVAGTADQSDATYDVPTDRQGKACLDDGLAINIEASVGPGNDAATSTSANATLTMTLTATPQ